MVRSYHNLIGQIIVVVFWGVFTSKVTTQVKIINRLNCDGILVLFSSLVTWAVVRRTRVVGTWELRVESTVKDTHVF